MKRYKWGVLHFTILIIFLVGCSSDEQKAFFVKAEDEEINHIHGAGYWGKGGIPVLATHEGLLEYQDGAWYKTTRNNHDYMGFQPTKEGFYSSGHPESGSGLKNPLGLVESKDKGESLDKLAFYGEIDFHYLGASYETGTVYVLNEVKNSEIGPGFFYSKNKGKDWVQLQLNGLTSSSVGGFAVHPSDDNTIAIYTEQGIFLSKNYGMDFSHIQTKGTITSLAFKKDSLIYSMIEDNQTTLNEMNLNNKMVNKFTSISFENQNSPIYVNSNPQKESEMMIVTVKNDVFISGNGGKEWDKILSNGETE
ncbi:F510_1955 family glycosylhydrolase [Peribacillus sp. Hz7]|uniref:F510_1955 family glycosylhydrolase n=1 Tax=Peribacillus sp. Hz7 TaxID=3344873 RepID=UPI0035CA3BEC